MQSMANETLCSSCECNQFLDSNHAHNLPNWLEIKLNQIAPIVLGKQAKYPLEFWHKIVGLPNNDCLLEDVPVSSVSSSEIFDLFNYPTHDSSKKLSIYHIKNDTQGKKLVEWHNKVYCCQPYNGELCQCFVRAYLAHFGGRINVNWARTAYEYYKRLQEQDAMKDPHMIHTPIPTLNEQLLGLKNLFIEITSTPVSFTQPNSFCCFNLDQSNKKEHINKICSDFVKKNLSEKITQTERNSNLIFSINNPTILKENENNMFQKSYSTLLYQQKLESKIIDIFQKKNLMKPNVFTNDINKDSFLTGNKQVMISQQVHSCAMDLSNKNVYSSIQSPSTNDHIGSTGLFTLGLLKTAKEEPFATLEKFNNCNSFGKSKECNSFQEARSVVDELIGISTSGSEEVSARGVSIENDIFSPRLHIDNQFINTNYVKNQISSSTQNIGVESNSIIHCLNASPRITYENSSIMLQCPIDYKKENFTYIPKFIKPEQLQNINLELMIPQINDKNKVSINENLNLENLNNHSQVLFSQKEENSIKPKQRIGISIVIQKSSEHNDLSSIKKEKNEHQVRYDDAQQDTIACSPKMDKLSNIQKSLDFFQNNSLNSSKTTTTISPPHEKAPLSIFPQKEEHYDNIKENNYASKLHDLINEKIQESTIPTIYSNIVRSNCDSDSINSVDFKNELQNDDQFSKKNSKYMLEWSKNPPLSHETKITNCIQESINEGKVEFVSNESNILHNHVESTNNTTPSHLISKLNYSLPSFNSNLKSTFGTTHDKYNVAINTALDNPNCKTCEKSSKIHNSEDETTTKLFHLEVPPLHLDKVVDQNNKSIKEIEEIRALNVMSSPCDLDRIEISSCSCLTCSTQESDSYFPYYIALPNAQNTPAFTNEQSSNRTPKQQFCATLVHNIKNCDMDMKYNSFESSIISNSKNDSTNCLAMTNRNIEHKSHVRYESKDDKIECNEIEKIFDHKNVLESPQISKECTKSMKQYEAISSIEAKNEIGMRYAIKSSIPSMKCAQAEYILEKKKGALALEKARVEDLIWKDDSQHVVNQQLKSILRSKLEAYDKLRLEVQNLIMKISEDDESHSQLSIYRKDKRNKEHRVKKLQKEIVQLHKIHRDVQIQLDIRNCMLIESLMVVDNLALDAEKAQKQVEQIIKEESLNQRLVSSFYLIPISMYSTTSSINDRYNNKILKNNYFNNHLYKIQLLI